MVHGRSVFSLVFFCFMFFLAFHHMLFFIVLKKCTCELFQAHSMWLCGHVSLGTTPIVSTRTNLELGAMPEFKLGVASST